MLQFLQKHLLGGNFENEPTSKCLHHLPKHQKEIESFWFNRTFFFLTIKNGFF